MEVFRTGGDIVSGASKISEKLGIPLKNWHLPGHKFTGPFTELDKRIDKYGNPLPGYEPYNQIDAIALNHDKCYERADTLGTVTRKDCDKIMLNELNATKTKGLREKIDYALVKPVIWLKHKLGLGLYDNLHLAKELHKPIHHKYKRRRILVFNIDDIWSADLKDMSNLAKYNKGYKYLLNVIDLFSKYAFTIPLKSKKSKDIINAFEKLFGARKPNKLWTDQGSEFINNNFKKFLNDRNIELYHVYNEGKACVIERFNRTLGEMIQKYLTGNDTNKYIDVLQKIIDEYNHKYHCSIKMTPVEASKLENESKILKSFISKDHQSISPKYKVNDRVRISRYKKTFEKGYAPNWTKEIFIIKSIKNTDPITYTIKDLNDENILGSFYEQELQHTKF